MLFQQGGEQQGMLMPGAGQRVLSLFSSPSSLLMGKEWAKCQGNCLHLRNWAPPQAIVSTLELRSRKASEWRISVVPLGLKPEHPSWCCQLGGWVAREAEPKGTSSTGRRACLQLWDGLLPILCDCWRRGRGDIRRNGCRSPWKQQFCF